MSQSMWILTAINCHAINYPLSIDVYLEISNEVTKTFKKKSLFATSRALPLLTAIPGDLYKAS
jgi:hypothetical protein